MRYVAYFASYPYKAIGDIMGQEFLGKFKSLDPASKDYLMRQALSGLIRDYRNSYGSYVPRGGGEETFLRPDDSGAISVPEGYERAPGSPVSLRPRFNAALFLRTDINASPRRLRQEYAESGGDAEAMDPMIQQVWDEFKRAIYSPYRASPTIRQTGLVSPGTVDMIRKAADSFVYADGKQHPIVYVPKDADDAFQARYHIPDALMKQFRAGRGSTTARKRSGKAVMFLPADYPVFFYHEASHMNDFVSNPGWKVPDDLSHEFRANAFARDQIRKLKGRIPDSDYEALMDNTQSSDNNYFINFKGDRGKARTAWARYNSKEA